MSWDRLANFYDVFENLYNGKCNRGIEREIEKLVKPEDTVLECACGTGLLTVPMARKSRHVTATDLSEGMMKKAQKKLAGSSNVSFETANITNLPYENNSFDVVVAANVIHLLDNPDKALEEMKRVCRPGGRIIIPTYITDQKADVKLTVGLLKKIGANIQKEFTYDEYKEFFRSRGIKASYKVVKGHMPCAFALIKLSNGK